jgi:hypothetical protein
MECNIKNLTFLLNKPWFYFLLSLIHQAVLFAPGPFPTTFPDSGTYLSWHPQRTPLYPLLLSLFGSIYFTALFQVIVFALAVVVFHLALRLILQTMLKTSTNAFSLFLWGGSLYFATNFELVQFSPTILTESLGISFFLFYFLTILAFRASSPGLTQKILLILSFLVFPILLFFLRPSFILVPVATSIFLILEIFFRKFTRNEAFKSTRNVLLALLCLVLYGGSIVGYAFWNRPRLGHVGISDIAQHQIFANYMAQGVLLEEAEKPETSPELKAFGAANKIINLDPNKRGSQYLLFEQWQEMNPGKDLYTNLVLVNQELLSRRFLGYIKAALRNLSSLIDGRASFNYYPIEHRDRPSWLYFWVQFILDNLFAGLWFVALIYFFMTIAKRPLFGNENLLFVLIASQFLTIAFVGYSELRRQSIGVGSIQVIFVMMMWIHLLKRRIPQET